MDARQAAYLQVYEAEHERLRRWLRAKLDGADLANDLTQEAFTRLWREWDTVQGGDPAAWVWTVARRLLISHYRRQHDEVWLSPWRADPDGGWQERAEMRVDLARPWPWLTAKQRLALTLHFGEGWTYPEIAAAMGLGTPEAARGLAQRGWHRLKPWLDTGARG